jgi:hypothetical protein
MCAVAGGLPMSVEVGGRHGCFGLCLFRAFPLAGRWRSLRDLPQIARDL